MIRRSSAPAWGLLVFAGTALILSFLNLSGFLMNDDEGTYLYAAWRVGLGEVPYRDFNVVQSPLSFYLGAGILKLSGQTVWGARALAVMFMLGSAWLLYAAARRFFHLERGFAAAAAGIFLFNKHVFFLGRSFMPDVPMMFFAAAALFAGLRGEEENRAAKSQRRDAFLAGLWAGLAALSKLNGILVLVGYLAFLALEGIRRRETRKSALAKAAAAGEGFLLSFGIPFGLLLGFVPGSYQGLIGFHAASEGIAGLFSPGLILERLIRLIGNHNYGLAAGVVAVLLFGRADRDRRKTLLWFVAAAVTVLVFLPGRFFLRYVIFAFVPFALLFGLGVRNVWKRKPLAGIGIPILAVPVLLCLAPTLSPKKILAEDHGTPNVVAFILDHTNSGDYVFGDDPFLNFLAGRPCPPRLVDVSEAMVTSGRVTASEIIEDCERCGVKLIFVEKGASAHHLVNLRDFDRFQNYLDEKYRPAGLIRREFLDVELYLRAGDESRNHPSF